ncbi:5'-nucleotidase C-terminal domain-containing protein [Brachybacterium sp. JHP9]|uniref:5'-nucleotidase C-terminal domain-containing protein n=1 Tax=Brachybacterium equifaecis TaxID=2910770 RepID=A0ABT0QZR5_9MICO|nr:5'-nucleotidase C-terminal domain-containing protein [Brachybacterium equifaecis]MCL6423101.1 5'-nucleotidase C-terminal domain-containing protein [Brachybacterium equifaecis]
MSSSFARRSARRSAAGLGLAAVTLTSALAIGGPVLAAGTGDQVTLFNINDFHGRITATAKPLACTLVTQRAGVSNSAFLASGDLVGASEFASYIQNDQPTIDYLNALGLQASATGNHEYDQGYADLRDRIAKQAKWPYLAVNVYEGGKRTTPAYALVDAGDVKVAVVGAVTQETPALTSPAGLAGIEFRDPVASVNTAIAELKASGEKYDVLVVEYHEGSSASAPAGSAPTAGALFDTIVNETSAEADVIFNAHTHQTYSFQAPVPGQSGETRPIMQTGSYGENLGKVTLELGADGDWDAVPAKTGLVPTKGADLAACASDPTYAAAAAISEKATKQGDIAAQQSVGTITGDVTTAFAPNRAEYVNGVWTRKADAGASRGDDRGSASALSNGLAESMVWATNQDSYGGTKATIGVMNPGGVRADLNYAAAGAEGDGVVTYKEANDIVPFVNNLSTTQLTGAQFVQLLEEQWQRNADGTTPSRGYLQLGLSDNVTYTYDASQKRDERITSVMIDGEPIDLDATYTVVAASFLVAGGDNFHTFAKGTGTTDTGLLDRDAWIDYLKAHQNLAPDYSARGAQVVLGEAADGGTLLTISGVESRSLGAPQVTQVSVEIAGATYSAPYTAQTGGSFAAQIAIPAGAIPRGDHLASITTTPEAGTEILVPVSFEDGLFTDVPEDLQFADEIYWAADQGYVTGWADGSYRPFESVNRDAMAAFLYRMAGSPAVDTSGASPFTDIKAGDEHYAAVLWAYQEGITTGWVAADGTREFRPVTPIDRDAMAAFVYRYAGEPSASAPAAGPFTDVPAGLQYAKEIAWLKAQGITTGYPDATYRPWSPMKRDAMAAFMYRMDKAGVEFVDN